jgi:cytochrome P450
MLGEMTYLHAALTESLRLYPPLPIDIKHVADDDILPDGYRVKKGHKVLYSIYSMGRMESIWGPDCATFRPERWLVPRAINAGGSEEGGDIELRRDVSAFRFAAFNAGPRTCLGKDMAYVLMKSVASTLLLHFRVKLVPGHEVLPKPSVTLYMKHGFLVTLEPRRR